MSAIRLKTTRLSFTIRNKAKRTFDCYVIGASDLPQFIYILSLTLHSFTTKDENCEIEYVFDKFSMICVYDCLRFIMSIIVF